MEVFRFVCSAVSLKRLLVSVVVMYTLAWIVNLFLPEMTDQAGQQLGMAFGFIVMLLLSPYWMRG